MDNQPLLPVEAAPILAKAVAGVYMSNDHAAGGVACGPIVTGFDAPIARLLAIVCSDVCVVDKKETVIGDDPEKYLEDPDPSVKVIPFKRVAEIVHEYPRLHA